MAETSAAHCAQTPAAPGVTLVEGGADCAVFSRNAERISICLFDPDGRERARFRLDGRDGDLRHGFVPGVTAGQRYGLRADGPWSPRDGLMFDPAKLLVDPYASRLDRPFAYDPALAAPRGAAIDTAHLVPKAIVEPLLASAGFDAARRAKTDRTAPPRLIYEVCIKAHTRLDPAVPLALRGTLAGLAAPRVIERLVRLGVSHVELMPVTPWIDERHLAPLGLSNAWGYNPVCFMALDPRLAPGGFADLRAVVDALRAAGIGVLLDVVFNHSGEGDGHGPTLSLRGLDDQTYYRRAPDGHFINDSGCGNVLDCDQPIVRRLVLDSLRRFVTFAGVAGFRFDLATTLGRSADGFHAESAMLQQIADDEILRDRLLIAEPWDIGPGGYQVGNFRPPWREWNDRFRDDVRRFWRGDRHAAGAFATRIAGSADLFDTQGRAPSASVNFLAAHDGFALRDLVSYSRKHNFANGEHNRDGNGGEICWNGGVEGETDDAAILARRAADVRALLATLFLARGTPMLTAGDECGRTQRGNNNAYAQDNETIWLDWAAADQALTTFVAGLAHLRALLPALGEDRFLTGEGAAERHADAVWTRADGRLFENADWAEADVIGLTLASTTAEGGRAHLLFNRSASPVGAAPPAPGRGCDWRLALDSSSGYVGVGPMAAATTTCPARAVLVFVEVEASS